MKDEVGDWMGGLGGGEADTERWEGPNGRPRDKRRGNEESRRHIGLWLLMADGVKAV